MSDHDLTSADPFERTRMPFGDHLEELRVHLWRAIKGFGVIFLAVFVLDAVGYATSTPVGVAWPVLQLIAHPVRDQLQRFQRQRLERKLAVIGKEPRDLEIEFDLRELARRLGLPANPEGGPEYAPIRGRVRPETWLPLVEEIQRLLNDDASLKTTGPTEAMMVYFKTAAVCGLVLGSPWILWQLWAFVAAGLHPHEKRYVHRYLPFSLGLFLAGVLVCQFLVMPRAIEALLWFNDWLGIQPDLRLSEWVGFAVVLPVVFGVSFQTPLVMRLAEQLGLFSADDYRRRRRPAWFALAVFAAVLTPSLDAVSLLFLWIPMGLLYELGIVLCRLSPRAPVEDLDVLAEV